MLLAVKEGSAREFAISGRTPNLAPSACSKNIRILCRKRYCSDPFFISLPSKGYLHSLTHETITGATLAFHVAKSITFPFGNHKDFRSRDFSSQVNSGIMLK